VRSLDGYAARIVKGTVIDDRYVLGDLLGSGGMARVFLAHDEVLGRDVALKILWEQYADNEEFVERFKREARSAAALAHPNIVSVYDWGDSEDEMYYMAMEYVSGGTLKERIIDEGALDPGIAAELGCQVAEALGVAHKRGVIHRDVKPQNILLTASGEVKVADFGIARAVGAMAATAVSRSGVVLGTVAYMSPEQAMGEPVGPASDLYSLGVVLYEMLTGNLPYEAESPIALAVKHVSEPVCPPKEVNPEVPEGMNALVSGLLAKKPEDRHQSAVEVAEDLQRVCDGLMPSNKRPTRAQTKKAARTKRQTTAPIPLAATIDKGKKRRRKAARMLVCAFALLALLGDSGWSWFNSSQVEDLAPDQEDSQEEVAPAPEPENEATEASEEAKQAPSSVEVTSAKEPTQPKAPSTATTQGTGLKQTPSSQGMVGSRSFTPALVNDPVDLAPLPALQPAPTQQAQVQVMPSQQDSPAQVASDQQSSQVQEVSSQTSNEGESGSDRISGTQKGQATDQVFQSPKSSDK
jgi:eukaryotic-like serine/threonine-protein kinase